MSAARVFYQGEVIGTVLATDERTGAVEITLNDGLIDIPPSLCMDIRHTADVIKRGPKAACNAERLIALLGDLIPAPSPLNLLAAEPGWSHNNTDAVMWTEPGEEKAYVIVSDTEFPTQSFAVQVGERDSGAVFYRNTEEEAVTLARSFRRSFEALA